jgi:hypothetical protein
MWSSDKRSLCMNITNISDTRYLVRPEAFAGLQGCDQIIQWK